MKTPKEEYPLYAVPNVRQFQDILRHGMEHHPDRLALADLSETPIAQVSYRQLFGHVLRFGRALLDAGCARRDHVAIIAENRVQWGIAYLAVTSFDMVAVPIDRNLQENEILTILHASRARVAIFSESFRDMFGTFQRSVRDLEILVDMDLPARRGTLHAMKEMMDMQDSAARVSTARDSALDGEGLPTIDPDALSVLVFTSGSMGRAKGVMLSQSAICANLRGMLQMVEIRSDDRFLSVLPIHHTYECTCGFLCPLVAGASAHYARSLKTVAEDMLRVRPTILLGVPLLFEKMYRRIMQAIAEKKLVAAVLRPLQALTGALESLGVQGVRRKLFHEVHERFGGAIRILIAGGAAPDIEVSRGFRALGFSFLQGYGLTETSPILALNRLRKFKDEAAGLPLPGVTLRIDDPDGEGRGEILASGPSLMLGYYRNAEATAEVLQDGWLRTGDFGSIDEDGFLHINGRKKNVIIARNGENVFPEEIEDEVNRIPLVLECVVYGKKDESGNESIAVMIVPEANLVYGIAESAGVEVTPAYVRELLQKEIRVLNRRLPVHKQIRSVEVKETEFEKTTTQKIKRYLVQGGSGD
ncbi:MAG: AMP-binding protein [Bacteroidota bacterium]|nr:AMP-binding protein [Bacteroidota bacterium]